MRSLLLEVFAALMAVLGAASALAETPMVVYSGVGSKKKAPNVIPSIGAEISTATYSREGPTNTGTLVVRPGIQNQWYILANGPENLGRDQRRVETKYGCDPGSCLADDVNGKFFLMRSTPVVGVGQFYSYHVNSLGHDLQHGLWAFNDTESPATVIVHHYSLMPSPDAWGIGTMEAAVSERWQRYYASRPSTMTIPAHSGALVFSYTVPSGSPLFGALVEMSVSVPIVLTELAWRYSFDRVNWLTSPGRSSALENGCCGRGTTLPAPSVPAEHAYAPELTMNFGAVGVTPTIIIAGGTCDGFSTAATAPTLTAPDGAQLNATFYGRIYNVTAPIVNTTGSSMRVRLSAVNPCHDTHDPQTFAFTIRYPSRNFVRILPLRQEGAADQYMDFYEAVLQPGQRWTARFQILGDGPDAARAAISARVCQSTTPLDPC